MPQSALSLVHRVTALPLTSSNLRAIRQTKQALPALDAKVASAVLRRALDWELLAKDLIEVAGVDLEYKMRVSQVTRVRKLTGR